MQGRKSIGFSGTSRQSRLSSRESQSEVARRLNSINEFYDDDPTYEDVLVFDCFTERRKSLESKADYIPNLSNPEIVKVFLVKKVVEFYKNKLSEEDSRVHFELIPKLYELRVKNRMLTDVFLKLAQIESLGDWEGRAEQKLSRTSSFSQNEYEDNSDHVSENTIKEEPELDALKPVKSIDILRKQHIEENQNSSLAKLLNCVNEKIDEMDVLENGLVENERNLRDLNARIESYYRKLYSDVKANTFGSNDSAKLKLVAELCDIHKQYETMAMMFAFEIQSLSRTQTGVLFDEIMTPFEKLTELRQTVLGTYGSVDVTHRTQERARFEWACKEVAIWPELMKMDSVYRKIKPLAKARELKLSESKQQYDSVMMELMKKRAEVARLTTGTERHYSKVFGTQYEQMVNLVGELEAKKKQLSKKAIEMEKSHKLIEWNRVHEASKK